MLSIPCPHCGLRDETEFVNGGEADILRPAPDCSEEEWAAYLFTRANPKGPLRERWFHRFGCRRWLIVTRHTLSHEILP